VQEEITCSELRAVRQLSVSLTIGSKHI